MRRLDVFSDYAVGCLIAVVVLYGLGSALLEQLPELPEPVSEDPCSCAGRPQCQREIYQIDEQRRAYVVTYGKREHCVVVEAL